jgi:predicted ribosomally synthesized peptide with nif11-like leader
MSKTELERFRTEMEADPRLQQELSALAGDSAALVHWAAGRGYDLTPAELEGLAGSCGELSDEDLEQAAGGWTDPPPPTPPPGSGGGG